MALPLSLDTSEYEFLVSPLTSVQKLPVLREPPTCSVTMTFGVVSDVGRVCRRNEDHYMVAKLRRSLSVLDHNLPPEELAKPIAEEAYAIVVADGMGGMNAGDVASMLAISTGVKLADKSVKWGFNINEKEARDLLTRLSAYFCEIDSRITRKSESDRRLLGMGTTLTVVCSVGFHLFVVHVGDSRAYLYRKGQLQRLTRDHTVAQALADAGTISQAEVRKHSRRNALTNYLGGHGGKVKADVRWLRLEDGDRILVCSDGLTDMVDDYAIAACLEKTPDPTIAANALTQAALDQGGADNITVVVANYSVPPSPASSPPRQESGDVATPPVDTLPIVEEPGHTRPSPR